MTVPFILSSLPSPYVVCLGLKDVIEALLFLHDNAGACHNNVALSSVLG